MKAITVTILFILVVLSSCRKDWLEERSNNALVVPSSLEDLQAILDNTRAMNGNTLNYGVTPSLGETASDDHYIEDNIWSTLSRVEDKNAYIWNTEIFEGGGSLSWNNAYITVFYANTVLDELEKLTPEPEDTTEYNSIKGSALFYRAHAFFWIAQIYAGQYDERTASSALGIPLRTSSDFNLPTTRSSMAGTYGKIISDLVDAGNLLPDKQGIKTRPSKAAVCALLARIYLIMGSYERALNEADSSLSIYSDLMDYNTLNLSASLPFERFNQEVIFDASMTNSLSVSNHIIVDSLYGQYEESDGRKTAYFITRSGNLKFKGSYTRSANVMFSGLATDEIYLIRAECNARVGNIEKAITDIKLLLSNRYISNGESGGFLPIIPADKEQLIALILKERRKELVFRGLRWLDLRRLNKQGANIVLKRTVNGNNYTLEPTSLKYTFPIPDDVLNQTGIEQNER